MLNLDKLNTQLDLKDIDPEKIVKLILEHQKTLIKIVLIGGALLMGGSTFNDYRVKVQGLKTQMSDAQDKLDAMKACDKANDDFNTFKSSIPSKLNETELISLISKYAKLNQVYINNLTPGDSRDMGLYDEINLNFDATTDSFKDLLLFLRKIEKSKYPLRVDSWAGQEVEKGKVGFSIKLSAVLIHT